MEDNCQTRCGKPTWHSLPNVGLLAINDASMLRSFIYEMLKNNFDQNTSTKMENCINEVLFTVVTYMLIFLKSIDNRNHFHYLLKLNSPTHLYKVTFNQRYRYSKSLNCMELIVTFNMSRACNVFILIRFDIFINSTSDITLSHTLLKRAGSDTPEEGHQTSHVWAYGGRDGIDIHPN